MKNLIISESVCERKCMHKQVIGHEAFMKSKESESK